MISLRRYSRFVGCLSLMLFFVFMQVEAQGTRKGSTDTCPSWVKTDPKVGEDVVWARVHASKFVGNMSPGPVIANEETTTTETKEKNFSSLFSDAIDTPTPSREALPDYREYARKDAFYELVDKVKLKKDSLSLISSQPFANKSDVYNDWWNAYYKLLLECGIEEMSWDGDPEEYWYYCSVGKTKLRNAIAKIENERVFQAKDKWVKALQYEKIGMIQQAGACYMEAFNQLLPLIYRSVAIDDLDGDFCQIVYDKCVHIFDGISITSQLDQIPAVSGEPVPVNVGLKVTKGDMPLKGMKINCAYQGGDIRIIEHETGADGICHFTIEKASDRDRVASFAVASTMTSTLPESLMPADASSLQAIMAKVLVYLFKPTTNVGVSVAPENDNLKLSLRKVIKGLSDDLVLLDDQSTDEDLVVKADIFCTLKNPIDYAGSASGKKLAQYEDRIVVTVMDKVTGKELAKDEVTKIVNGSYSEELLKNSALAVKLLKPEVEAMIPGLLKGVDFNKREKCWEQLRSRIASLAE